MRAVTSPTRVLQLDVGAMPAAGAGAGAEYLSEVYDAARGLPVLHDTALQLTVAFADAEAGAGAGAGAGAESAPQCTVDGRVVDGLHVTASREQYEQLLDTLQWLGDSAPDEPDAAPPHHHHHHHPDVCYRF